jgi:hypothetical protein
MALTVCRLALRFPALPLAGPNAPAVLARFQVRVPGLDSFIVFRHLLRQRIIRTKHFSQRRCGQATDSEPGGAIQEFAAVDAAMYIAVKKTEQLGIEITGLFSVHGRAFKM